MKQLFTILFVFLLVNTSGAEENVENQLIIPEGELEGFHILDRLLGKEITKAVKSITDVYDISFESSWFLNLTTEEEFYVKFTARTTKGKVFENIECRMRVRKPTDKRAVDGIRIRSCGNDEAKIPSTIELGIAAISYYGNLEITPYHYWSETEEN